MKIYRVHYKINSYLTIKAENEESAKKLLKKTIKIRKPEQLNFIGVEEVE